MKIAHLFTLLVWLAFLVSCGEKGSSTSSLESSAEVLSYSLGVNIGNSLKQGQFSEEERNTAKLVEGFMAGFEIDSAELAFAMETLQQRMGPGGKPDSTEEGGSNIALQLGKTIMGPLAVEIDMDKADFDRAALQMGLDAGMGKDSIVIDQEARDSVLQVYMGPKQEAYMAVARAKQEAAMEARAAAAKPVIEEGEKFLAENKERDGIITTESGLQYEILNEGKGAQATIEDQVKVHYHGTLLDGSVFDSSVDRGEPAIFPVGGVIRGWQEGIPLMKEGARYRFYIPQELAYGMNPPSPSIPAGALLIFDVELFEVNPAPSMPK